MFAATASHVPTAFFVGDWMYPFPSTSVSPYERRALTADVIIENARTPMRVNGRDVALETMESAYGACGEISGEETACRVWHYQGEEYTTAPVGMIVEAILQGVYTTDEHQPVESVPYTDVPENLTRFFTGKAQKPSAAPGGCCAPSEQATCCAPSEKASCCGTDTSQGCGCK